MRLVAERRLGQAAILLATFLAYIPAIRGGFVWDDDDYVLENQTLRTADGLRQIWFDIHATPQYYPLVHTTFWIEYHLWGVNPVGYHVVNVLLHATSAMLLWTILGRLRVPGAWFAAALFAIHPVHVESVAWITERKNVLSGVFYLLATLACVRFFGLDAANTAGVRQWKTYVLAMLLFVCALLSKTVTCSLPVAILILLWWRRERLHQHDVRPLLPMFLIGAALGLTTAWLEKHHVGAEGKEWAFSLLDRCLLAGRALCFYLWKLLYPTDLTFIYPRWHIDSAVWWQYLYSTAVLGTFTVLWLLRRRIGKGPFAAMAFFAVTLVPALGFIDVYPMRFSFVADHFQYLASIGPIALLAAALWRLLGDLKPACSTETSIASRRNLVWVGKSTVVTATLAILGALTWQQGFMYKDLETLWRTTIARNPSAWLAHGNLSRVLLDRGDFAEADFYCHEAFRLKPNEPNALNNLGLLYQEQDRTDEALDLYQQCLRLKPDHASAHANLGRLLARQGKLEEGIAHLETAIGLTRHNQRMRVFLALALARKGAIERAVSQYRMTLDKQSTLLQACKELAELLVSQGYDAEAVQVYRHSIQQGSVSPDLLNNIAWLQATSFDPQARNGTEAVAHAQQALASSTDRENPLLLDTLGAAWAETGNFEMAVEVATRASKLAAQSGNTEVSQDILKRLAGFRQNQPWRENQR